MSRRLPSLIGLVIVFELIEGTWKYIGSKCKITLMQALQYWTPHHKFFVLHEMKKRSYWTQTYDDEEEEEIVMFSLQRNSWWCAKHGKHQKLKKIGDDQIFLHMSIW